jgi:hypothetical protein
MTVGRWPLAVDRWPLAVVRVRAQVHYPANSSQVQELFPAYAEARNITVTLHAGDMLYVPPYWCALF